MNLDRISKLEKLLAADPSDAFVLYSLAQEHGKGTSLDEFAKSLALYDRCIAADPNYCYAYYHKAKLLSEHERTEDAVRTLHDGLRIARSVNDTKALNEISALLDELE